MKRTYTPSIEEIDRTHGERYYTVSIGKRHQPHEAFMTFGTLENIINTMDATIYGIDPAAELDKYSARISYAGRDIVSMLDCTGPDSAQVLPQPTGDTYEIRQIDAWAEYDDPDDPDETPAWIWNTSYYIGAFTTASADVPRAFRRALANLGISFYRGRTRTEYDGDVYEIIDRETGEPLFCAVPQA